MGDAVDGVEGASQSGGVPMSTDGDGMSAGFTPPPLELKPGRIPSADEARKLRLKLIGQKANLLRRAGWYTADEVREIREMAMQDTHPPLEIERMLSWAVTAARDAGIVVEVGPGDA